MLPLQGEFCPWLVKKDANAMRGVARKKKKSGVILIAHVLAPLDITWNCIRGLGEQKAHL